VRGQPDDVPQGTSSPKTGSRTWLISYPQFHSSQSSFGLRLSLQMGGTSNMRGTYAKIGLVSFTLLFCSFLDWSQMHGQATAPRNSKSIVALVQRTHGQLTFKVEPDLAPGKDPLFAFNKLHDSLGSDYPVVAIVEDSAKISDLYRVSGIAAKAGFDNIRTFISHTDNGVMFEVKFGTAVPFSVTGPFDADFPPLKQSH
jgi:hypothetical protein